MIIEMKGEDLLIEDETRLDEFFSVHLCEDALEMDRVVILKVENPRGEEIETSEYDSGWALSMVQGHLDGMKKWKQIVDEAERAGVDL